VLKTLTTSCKALTKVVISGHLEALKDKDIQIGKQIASIG
jgi:hypothetical protein